MSTADNPIFMNTGGPSSHGCRDSGARAGALGNIGVYSGVYSSYFDSLKFSFTGVDSIIGRAFVVINGTDDCSNELSPNPVREQVACFGVIGYPPNGMNMIGGSASQLQSAPVLNATATVFNIIPVRLGSDHSPTLSWRDVTSGILYI